MTDKTTPKFELLVEGTAAEIALAESISVLRVHQHLDISDALELELSNDDLSWTESDTLAEGKKVALKLGYEGSDLVKVFEGQVVRRDCAFPVRGSAVVTVVAHDMSHKLKRGKKSRTFIDQKDSDIASQIAGELSLSADVEDSAVVHPYLFQNAQTDHAFLRSRAALIGYELRVEREQGKLVFKKPQTGSAAATLTWGENLLAFSPRMSTANQLSKVKVRGWDPVQKQVVTGEADTSKLRFTLDGSQKGAALAESSYGAAEVTCVEFPVGLPAEANALAEAILNAQSANYCEGEGSCQGDPALGPGSVVEIDGCGERSSGQYYVTKVLHHYEPSAGFSTHFSVTRSTERKSPGEREELPQTVSERADESPESPGWMEIRVRSETGDSLDGVSYVVTLPNGEQQRGTLDEAQTIRVEGIRDPGEAKIELNPPEELNALED